MIITLLSKTVRSFDVALLHPPGCALFDLPLNLYKKPWGWERILLNNQKLTHFPHQKKILFNRFKSSVTKSVIPNKVAIFM